MMARLEVGTIVRISGNLTENMSTGVGVNDDMLQYRGVTTRITNIRDSGMALLGYIYNLECDSGCWNWEDWMFEGIEHIKCSCCNEVIQRAIYRDPDGNFLCEDCWHEHCFICEECGNTHWRTGEYYHDATDEYLCESCWLGREDNIILNYHGFNDWKLHETGNETKYSKVPMGIELEVEREDSAISRQAMAKHLRDEFLGSLAVYENDGSLDDGFEIITHPMTYDYWVNEANDKITKALRYLSSNGYTSYDNRTCGLHIHVNKESLATNRRTQDEVIDNIILIMETFKQELVQFSRRSIGQISRWSHFLTTEDEDVSLSYVKDKKTTGDRYLALNLAKGKTIEFRIFKGTLIKESLYASIELVKNIVNIAKYVDIDGLTWKDIIEYHKTTNKYLMQYSNTTRCINSTKVLSVLDRYELNKENYSLEKFLKGSFVIDCHNVPERAFDRKILALATILYTKGVYLDYDGEVSDSLEKIVNRYIPESVLRSSDESKNIVEIAWCDHGVENVKLNTILRLWSNNEYLLTLKENKLSLVA